MAGHLVECPEFIEGQYNNMIENNWSVYILQCSDKTYYTGITNNIVKRLKAHQNGIGARYTSGRLPVKIVYQKDGFTEGEARKEEFRIKSLNRTDKGKLISFGEVA